MLTGKARVVRARHHAFRSELLGARDRLTSAIQASFPGGPGHNAPALTSLPRPRPIWAGVEPREVGEAARDGFWGPCYEDPLNAALMDRQNNRPIGPWVISNALSID